ncbi:hypothetical protein BH23ACT9_BH23ACT9_33790 [soil metagenome]
MASAEDIVRTYLSALKDPSSLRDADAVSAKESELDTTEDVIARLRLQDALRQLAAPSLKSIEDEFVVHGKAWADEQGVSAEAFAAEGVSTAVLRRAGFAISGRSTGGGRRKAAGTRRSSGTRVTTEQVVDAMPKGAFTVKMLREASGASPAVVRKAITQEVEAGRLADAGTDPDHSGPGRSPTLYRRG